jgi:hypothetical protein
MRIEFIYWPGNTEIQLVEDFDLDGWTQVKDRFYTSATHFYENTDHGMQEGLRAAEAFAMLGKTQPAPRIEGDWAEFHPEMQRWRKRHKDA